MCKLSCFIALLSILLAFCPVKGSEFTIASTEKTTVIRVDKDTDDLILWAVHDFAGDIEKMTGSRSMILNTKSNEKISDAHCIYIGQVNEDLLRDIPSRYKKSLEHRWEKFTITQIDNDLYIIGSDVRGTVYGLFEVAERIGISPWKWWADVIPEKQKNIELILPDGEYTSEPSVQYRGIFLNDEDWGLHPWAAKTFEPEIHDIGPKTYEKLFQLLLRLKGNTIWPAMHPCTKAFYTIPGNKKMAQKYHIVIGTSHAEPMLRNNVDEWDKSVRGAFNYFTNSDEVNLYWKERIKEVKDSTNEFIVTVGMRGIHDSKMEGSANQHEQVEMMHTIVENQRKILETILNKPADKIPQVLVPYKEVLTLYNAGLEVEDDITLMWTDDNYGYIRRLSNEEEQKRKGGSGVYYHLSYWGRPHDYLWLSSTQPGLIWYEMSKAFQNGARKVWIANVGDIKPAEYNMEFFLDLAWDINSINNNNIKDHLFSWAAREFSRKNAKAIADLMEEYYRLAFFRKPEFMGWSQTEPSTRTQNTEFLIFSNGNEVQRRINYYETLVNEVEKLKSSISPHKLDAYFQLVEYPVKCAALMNFKFLYAQLVDYSKNRKAEYRDLSVKAYQSIVKLTDFYNDSLVEGKWKFMMNMEPRGLDVFKLPHFDQTGNLSFEHEKNTSTECNPIFIQSADFSKNSATTGFEWRTINGLGYSNSAVTLFPLKNQKFKSDSPSIEYTFEVDQSGNYEIEIRCLPTHSNNYDQEIKIQADTLDPETYRLNTQGRSKAWKENVLRNYVSVIYPVFLKESGSHILKISVNQTGIVLDQIAVKNERCEDYYEIPVY